MIRLTRKSFTVTLNYAGGYQSFNITHNLGTKKIAWDGYYINDSGEEAQFLDYFFDGSLNRSGYLAGQTSINTLRFDITRMTFNESPRPVTITFYTID